MSDIVVETPRLVLRKWRPTDLENAFDIYGDSEVMRYLGGAAPVHDLEAMRERLELFMSRDYGAGLGFWAAEEKTSGRVVGAILLKNLPEAEEIEVGWHLGQEHWGKGFATEGAKAAIAHGFETVGLE